MRHAMIHHLVTVVYPNLFNQRYVNAKNGKQTNNENDPLFSVNEYRDPNTGIECVTVADKFDTLIAGNIYDYYKYVKQENGEEHQIYFDSIYKETMFWVEQYVKNKGKATEELYDDYDDDEPIYTSTNNTDNSNVQNIKNDTIDEEALHNLEKGDIKNDKKDSRGSDGLLYA